VFSEDPALIPLSEIMPVLACEEMYGESAANGQNLYSQSYELIDLVLHRADDHDGYAISVTLLSILGLSAVQI
jgi:hypothetical protein